ERSRDHLARQRRRGGGPGLCRAAAARRAQQRPGPCALRFPTRAVRILFSLTSSRRCLGKNRPPAAPDYCSGNLFRWCRGGSARTGRCREPCGTRADVRGNCCDEIDLRVDGRTEGEQWAAERSEQREIDGNALGEPPMVESEMMWMVRQT